MGALITLLALSVVMAVASFLAGILPLSISLSQSQLRLVSAVGMGILVGTSLIVIIPEGVETLYKSNEVSHGHARRSLESQYLHVRSLPSSFIENIHRDIPELEALGSPGPVIIDDLESPPRTPTDPGRVGILAGGPGHTGGTEQEEEHRDDAQHAWVGIALISGFILMFLVDKLPQLAPSPQLKAKTHNIALNQIGRRFNLSNSQNQEEEEEEAEAFIEQPPTPEASKRVLSTTIGLVIHAAADGIALGASSSTSHTDLSLIIFFAIMIHKAPAAFGLTSLLLRQGLSKRAVRAHLVVFSAAAPVGALLTYMAARVLGSGATNKAADTKQWTGILLLFSAGTFLYVAMHSMQEVLDGHGNKQGTHGLVNGSLERRDSSEQLDDPKLSVKDLGAACFGMILPLFLQVGHAH